MTNSIRQSDEPELRRRRKNFLQQCRRYGSDMTDQCDDVREEILKPANKYRNCRNDVTERLEPARMLTQNPPNQGAAGRQRNDGLTNGQFAPKLTSMRRQMGGERGRKKTRNPPEQKAENAAKNGDAAAYGRACGKICEVETWRCQTAQAVKVWHLQTEIWQERNSRNSRMAQGDVL